MKPKKLDRWLAKHTPNLYTVLWTWHITSNDPPIWSYESKYGSGPESEFPCARCSGAAGEDIYHVPKRCHARHLFRR